MYSIYVFYFRYNTSFLGNDSHCPKEEILKLENILFGGKANYLTPRVKEVVGKNFPITSLNLEITGACLLEKSFLDASDHTFENKENQANVKYYYLSIFPVFIFLLITIIATVLAYVQYKRPPITNSRHVGTSDVITFERFEPICNRPQTISEVFTDNETNA